jgi:hypothetical protein
MCVSTIEKLKNGGLKRRPYRARLDIDVVRLESKLPDSDDPKPPTPPPFVTLPWSFIKTTSAYLFGVVHMISADFLGASVCMHSHHLVLYQLFCHLVFGQLQDR